MTATLRLTPLSREECGAILKKKGKILTSGDGFCPPAPGEEHARNTITLKLCSHTDDVIDVDNDDIMPEVVKHALKYEDGSTAATTILGRQKGTGIKCVTISRALCDVSLAEKSSSPVASMRMRKPPNAARPDGELAKTSHHVHLDGELVRAPLGEEIPLTNGSIIALYGATGFAYQVIFQNDDGDAADAEGARQPDFGRSSPKRKKPHPEEETLVEKKRQPTERERIRQRAHKVMEEEFTCAMCMDILVKSTFAFPCSHAFCEKCSKSIVNAAAAAAAPIPSSSAAADTVSSSSTKGKCPTCRGDVLEWMPARSYDTQVWSFALQGCFEKTDAEDFLERRQLVGEDPPTEEERGSILNIGEGEEGNTTDKKMTEHTAKCKYVASLSNKKPETTNFIRTLPRLNSTEMISNANNGIQVVNLAAYNYRVKSADNDVICID
ncbi:hypothetical protein ACHAW5_008286 [Stephanodiscus triporus]|uniref:RING-type domain-containing protein n=1 Tax=Stephanodiscus triporus TaxID=2934178 RepID=A0ABD3PBY9_9STRA